MENQTGNLIGPKSEDAASNYAQASYALADALLDVREQGGAA